MDQIERAVQAQWYSTEFMNAQNKAIHIQDISKIGEDRLSKQCKEKLNENSISYKHIKA